MSAVSNGFLPVLQERSGPEAFDLGDQRVGDGAAERACIDPAGHRQDQRCSGSLKGKTLDDATKVFNSPDVADATAHLEAWTSDHC